MGAKIKTPKKIPGPKLNPKNFLTKFSSLKIFQKALNDIIITFYFIWFFYSQNYAANNLQIISNTPKNPFIDQATQKITRQIFRNQKFPAPKNLSLIPVTWNSEYPPTPQGFQL